MSYFSFNSRVYIGLIVCKNGTRNNADIADLRRILFRHVGIEDQRS